MKRSMIWVSLLREIRGSLGRFLAIFGIVALGVGLFAGLKITKQDFLKSTTEYYEKTAFYDYRIIGELGFSDEQVRLFAGREDVAAAEGALSFDAYYDMGGNVKVGRFHSITNNVNQLVLVAGRMPENAGECLADAYYNGKGVIGRKVNLNSENSEEDLEYFDRKVYKVVGLVKSPLYIQFERGNSTLGTGSIDSFFYLPRESFPSDNYTEVYVKLKQDFPIYSQEYQDYLAEREDDWKALLKEASGERLKELPSLIAEAETKLSEKRDEAQEKLDEALAELNDARAKIDEAQEKLEDGRKELDQGWKDLEQAKLDLEKGKKEIEEKAPELEKGWKELEAGQKKIEENEALLKEKETELTQGKTQLETARMTLQLGEMQYKLTLESQIEEQKAIDSSKSSLDEREKTLAAREAFAATLGLSKAYEEEFTKEREAIAKERADLEKQLSDLSRRFQENNAVGAQVAAGKKEFEENEKKVKEGEAALQQGKELLLQAKKDLIAAQKKLEQGEAQLKEGKKQIEEGEKKIAEGEKTLAEKELEYADGVNQLEDGKKKLQEGTEEYEDALKQFNEKMADAQAQIDKLWDRYEKGKAPSGYLLGRNTNIGYVCFESDSAIVDGIANVFPVFFFLVAALICVTTMNRMVEEQRTQIGVLKALGYSDGRIMFKFLFYSGSAALSGAVIGYFAGTHLFPYIIWTVYGIIYLAGPIAFDFNPALAMISLTVSLLCSVGATYLSCRKELSANASTLMRPRAPKAGKRVLLEYVTFLWKRLSFLRKVAVRNIMRYKKRFFMMVLGIGGCTALLLTGFGLKDSIVGVAEMHYSEIQLMDLSLTRQSAVDDAFLEKLEALRNKGLQDYLIYQESSLDLVTEKGQKSITALTFASDLPKEQFEQFIHLQTEKGKEISRPKEGEAVVTAKIAKMLGVKVGEEIVLRDSSQKEIRVKVTGLAKNYLFNYVFLDQSTWENVYGGKYQPKSAYIKVSPGRDIGELAPKVMKLDGVANVTVTREMVKRFNTMMESMNLIVILITACAAGLAFIVLFNLTNINLTERVREIATIKVLGFYPQETALYVFRENFVLTILGAFVGLGMGIWLHSFVISEINVDMVSFGVRILPQSFAYSVLLTILFSLFISLMMNGKIDAISMTESLKSVD